MSDPYRQLPTRILLQRVARARADGDWRAARAEWEACVARARQRVELVVERYVRKGWILPADREDVVQETLVRGGRALVANLDKLTEDAFFAGMVRCADFQCRDAGRAEMRRQMRQKPLDARSRHGDDPGDSGRYDTDAARRADEAWRRDEEIREAGHRVDDLVGRLRDERARKLLTLQRLGTDDAAIAEAIGVTVGNLYQIRSRAFRELRGLMDP